MLLAERAWSIRFQFKNFDRKQMESRLLSIGVLKIVLRKRTIIMDKKSRYISGASADAALLTAIKIVTTVLSLITTRLLSEHLSIHDYGTYSQILLIVSTVASLTIFGMMDGMNYFYCRESDLKIREAYTATIFVSQLVLGTIAGVVVMLLSVPLCAYFDNPDIKGLLIFAATLPTLQNLFWVLQVLIVSVGEARILAKRNFVVSLVRLITVLCLVQCFKNVVIMLAVTFVLDALHIFYFIIVLRKKRCYIRLSKADYRLLGDIMRYCAPMGIFIIVNSLNRDIDKYLISAMTDTETLAMYSNASKQLPFDIIMSSFKTVLIPYIVKFISQKAYLYAEKIYKLLIEIIYISTGILCFAALAVSPQLMKLLYSDKYTDGIAIFCIYILVDLFKFTNMTIVLAAVGKTKLLMMLGFGAIIFNVLLNVLLYNIMGVIGPAVATLAVTLILGVIMLYCNAGALKSRLVKFFDIKYLALFVAESIVLYFLMCLLRNYLENMRIHYFVILLIVGGTHGVVMLLLNGKRLLNDMKKVNKISRDNAI